MRVPKEPTKAMIEAGDRLTYTQERFKVSEVYRAMINAALTQASSPCSGEEILSSQAIEE